MNAAVTERPARAQTVGGTTSMSVPGTARDVTDFQEDAMDEQNPTASDGTAADTAVEATAATALCDVCARPVGQDEGRHPLCAAFHDAALRWPVTAVMPAVAQPCAHCGKLCRLQWDGVYLHAECQYEWFIAPWPAEHPPPATDDVVAAAQPQAVTPVTQQTGEVPPSAGTAAKATTGATSGDRRTLVAVADVDGIHLPDGSVQPLPERMDHIGHLADVAIALRLGWHYDRQWEVERGQLWLSAALVRQLGLPEKLPRDTDTKGWKKLEALTWLAGARHDGWTVLNQSLRAWTAVWRQGGGGALIVVPHWLGRSSLKRFDGADVDATTLARRAQMFADLVGIPYRNSPGHTGLRLLQWLHRSPQARSLHRPIDLPVPARQHPIQADLAWYRPLTEAERQRKYVIGLDQNGCYVNAANSLYVGMDADPVHVTGENIAFTAKTPGYWRVHVTDELPALLPNPLDPTGRGRLDDCSYWVMTPTVDFLRRERKVNVQILEAYVWEPLASVRFYDEWAAHLRELIYDAKTRALTDPDIAALLPTFKGLYTAGIGDLAAKEALMRPGDLRPPHENPERRNPLWRPDHRHLILARAQVGILRRAWTAGQATGMWPIAINTDAMYYVTDEPDPARLAAHLALPFDEIKWGSFKPAPGGAAGVLSTELIDAFDAPRGWGTVLDATLVDNDQWQVRIAAGRV